MVYNEAEALKWKKMYEEDGMTIEKIALEVHWSAQTVRNWLGKVDTKMRARGGHRGPQRNQAIDGIRGKSDPGLKNVTGVKNPMGHRRHKGPK